MEQSKLLSYLKCATYTDNIFVFGPLPKRDCSDLYVYLSQLGVGYYAQYVNASSVNDDKADVRVFVQFKQADKLAEALKKIDSALMTQLAKGI